MKYEPHSYQKYAIEYLKSHPVSALFLDCGLGKTSITLSAVNELLFDSFEVRKVLVIAPVRVAKFSWPDEIKKWDHLSELRYSLAVGTEEQRIVALNAAADIYIINRENIQWLVEKSDIPFQAQAVDLIRHRTVQAALPDPRTMLQAFFQPVRLNAFLRL